MSLLVLLAAAAQAPTQSAYPAREVLEGFAQVCRPLATLEGAAAAAEKSGWRKFEPEAASQIASLIAFGKSEGKKMLAEKGGEMLPTRVFHRTIAGEDLIVVLSGVKINGVLVNGCRAYDVGETRELPAAQVEAWLNRKPSKTVVDPAIHITSWEPGYDAQHDSFDLYFIPQGSPAIELLKVSGIGLKADFVGAVK